ncbi:prefoldin subunit alpha [Candidatus Woesearchaeota archaeon]|nr:prefoldin subunit alpha [Candidatus Woesearchaeota archaeon]
MTEKETKGQEIYMEYKAVEEHIQQLQKQLEALTSHLVEMRSTSNSLEELAKTPKGKEIFVPISSGIFAKGSISDTSDLLVNIGANVVVTKDIASAKKLIQHQIDQMKNVHGKMLEELEKMAQKAAELEARLQGVMSEA